MNSIDPILLREKLAAGETFFLIDVREEYEHADFNIGGSLIPMNTIFENIGIIPKDIPVVIYCAKGIRSAIVIQRLQEKYGFENLLNLEGGMYKWRSVADSLF